MEKNEKSIFDRAILIEYHYREYRILNKFKKIENSDRQKWQSIIKVEERA